MEFLIRTRDGHEWPPVRNDRVAAALTPSGWDCAIVAGWGDHRVRCGEAEIAFAAEHVGWQVSIEGPMSAEVAEQFIAKVAEQVEREVCEPVDWIQLTW